MSLNVCVSHSFPARARKEPEWEEHPHMKGALVHKKHGNVLVMVGSKWASASHREPEKVAAE